MCLKNGNGAIFPKDAFQYVIILTDDITGGFNNNNESFTSGRYKSTYKTNVLVTNRNLKYVCTINWQLETNTYFI